VIPNLSVGTPSGRAHRPRSASPATRILGAVVAVVAVGLAACSGATGSAGSPSASAAAPAITIRDAWVRPAAAGAVSAAYLTIANAGAADRLIAIKCTIAGSAMLHRTTTDPSGMTGMSMIQDLAIPAGTTVKLEPGGTHIMLTGLSQALVAGATVDLGLVFDGAGTLTVPAAVAAR
jgi:copper(I)-binding protein